MPNELFKDFIKECLAKNNNAIFLANIRNLKDAYSKQLKAKGLNGRNKKV